MGRTDEEFLKIALEEADRAYELDEVPIGAIVVIRSEDGLSESIVGRGRNRCEELKDPTAHAEMFAIREACAAAGAGRLDRATLYSTLEPCAMCAGAILHARIERVVFGAFDTKFGAAGSVVDLLMQSDLTRGKFNHTTEFQSGILLDECRERMQRFFREKRNAAQAAKLFTPKSGR